MTLMILRTNFTKILILIKEDLPLVLVNFLFARSTMMAVMMMWRCPLKQMQNWMTFLCHLRMRITTKTNGVLARAKHMLCWSNFPQQHCVVSPFAVFLLLSFATVLANLSLITSFLLLTFQHIVQWHLAVHHLSLPCQEMRTPTTTLCPLSGAKPIRTKSNTVWRWWDCLISASKVSPKQASKSVVMLTHDFRNCLRWLMPSLKIAEPSERHKQPEPKHHSAVLMNHVHAFFNLNCHHPRAKIDPV